LAPVAAGERGGHEVADLELTRGLWRIPETESRNANRSFASWPGAVEILQRRSADNAAKAPADQSEFVFPSYGATGHIAEPKMAWRKSWTGPASRTCECTTCAGPWEAGRPPRGPACRSSAGAWP